MKIKRILVCGKGYSFHHFKIKKEDYSLIIGYNFEEEKSLFDLRFFSKIKEQSYSSNPSVLLESDFIKQLNLSPIQIGSSSYGLFILLQYLEGKYANAIVDLVGFDHRFIYETNEKSFFDNSDFVQSFINIESQRLLTPQLKDFIKKLTLRFISYDEFADIDPKTGNHFQQSTSNVEIVGEITTNHFGDTERLIHLIKSASKAGVDAVKFQMRQVDTFYTKQKLKEPYQSPFGTTFWDYRKALELSDEQFKIIDELCQSLNLNYFFSVLDRPSFLKMMEKNPSRIKLPSTISKYRDYIEYVMQNFKGELVMSTGMTDNSYLEFVKKNLNPNTKLFLLHCISSYPVNILNTNLKIIKEYAKLGQNIIPGYSSHDIGDNASIFAVFCGAKMIEKHIKSGNTDFAHFDETALDVDLELKRYVNSIRQAEQILGSGEKNILACETHKY